MQESFLVSLRDDNYTYSSRCWPLAI